jgi:hypothetical protein
MSTHSKDGETVGTNLLMGAIIVASGFLLFAALVLPQSSPTVQPNTAAKPAVAEVVVTAPGHAS